VTATSVQCARSGSGGRLPSGYNIIAWQHLPHLDAFELTADDVTSAAYWIDADGQQHRGERAVGRALVEIGRLWAVLGRAIMLPGVRVVTAVLYRLITRIRHLMPGDRPPARLPTVWCATRGSVNRWRR
jgi:predicted DCC family thiol-disulfide oxidoreductase YuxK